MSSIKRALARIPVVGPYLQNSYWRYLEKRREVAATKPGLRVDLTQRPDPDFLRSLGYELEARPRPRRMPDPFAVAPPSWPAGDLYFVTVCTMNHVRFARTLFESVTRQHASVPFVVAVVDAPSRDSVSIEGAIVLTGRDVMDFELDYAALKFGARDLCRAARPYVLDYLVQHAPPGRLIYIDSDIYVFAPLDAMLEALDRSDFAVTPRSIAPQAGGTVLHAGMFGMRRGAETETILAMWKSLAPAFDWIAGSAGSVHLFRDPAYNVAYWNLHDRSLRYLEDRWTVNGRPLVAFHFSGFSPAHPFDLSQDNHEYLLRMHPAAARLCAFYVDRLKANDRGELVRDYGFDCFPSGVRIDALMREIFRAHEIFLQANVSPWTKDGEAHYARALLSPVPYSGSLAPILMKEIFERRRDLQILGDPAFDPRALIRWMMASGAREFGHEELVNRYRPVVPTHRGALLLATLREKFPKIFASQPRVAREDRGKFLEKLDLVAPADANELRSGATEYYLWSRVGLVRQFIMDRADLRAAFPDLLFDDGPALVDWLRAKRLDEHFLPEEAIETFASRTGGRSLARVFSYVSRAWSLMEHWPLALVGERSQDLARTLLTTLSHTFEFDADDIEMFLWIMEVKPWAGIPLTLELPIHTTRHPSSRSTRGQNEILAPVLSRDERFVEALKEYRKEYPPVADHAPRVQWAARDVAIFSVIESPRQSPRRVDSVPPGVNVFGYHKSQNGLGESTRGLVKALHAAGCKATPVLFSDMRMDDDLRPEDFIRKYDLSNGTNVFVSFPHHENFLLRTIPDEVTEGRRNIIHLAWEQRGGNHYWEKVFAAYDQIWAVSDFASESLARTIGRAVHTTPNVVDVTEMPPPALKAQHGIDPDEFTFLTIFDANSSTERKYPQGVIAAFRAAFRDDDRVRLIIRAYSADRIRNRKHLQHLLAAARSSSKIEIRSVDLTRTESFGLMSASDCYVSLHRGEGFGYTCAEAMAYGKPVIATGYSGNMQYMNESNSYPVRYVEVESSVREGPFERGNLWAEPDVRHAAELMRFVHEHRDEAARRGARGRETIAQELSPAAVGARIKRLLE